MTRSQKIIASLLLAGGIAVTVPFAVQARPGGPGGDWGGPGMMQGERGMFGGGHHMHRLLRGLDLTEAQRDQVFSLLHAEAPAMREKAKELRKLRMELQTLALSDTYDEAKAKSLADAGARVMADMAQQAARTGNKVYQLLTPEQRKALEEKRARFEAGGMGMRGGMGPGMGPGMGGPGRS